ncbi:N-acetylmuramoyl-L-alanine amidase family protein [Sporosarcina sp. FSL W7-1283]|uniref:N-acetylmuramoyl-L-alanine amidase family protein n=1 Tax=Sporosarcina sp. FSL W7-1283 TaxID=2921560 RepID=UPI0030FA4F0D
MALIVIDAGHGGSDGGAGGKYTNEKDNVLKVALRLKTLLEQAGHTVKLTRSTDVYLTLSQRAKLANQWRADFFISLHNNSAKNKQASGFETFIYNGQVSSKTIQFQKSVHKAILNELKIRDRGMKRANFAVLRETNMASCLIEYAFISNDEDENLLMNKVEQMARSTAQGIVNYVGGKNIPTVSSNSPTQDVIANNKGENGMLITTSATLKKAYQAYLQKAIDKKIIQPKWLQDYNKGQLSISDAIHLDILIRDNM